jgi:hypothetical protein
MSSGKLDQSLDEILSTQRRAAGRRNPRRAAAGNRPAAAAPAGGVQKATKGARNAAKPTPAKRAGAIGESKIMVSNLVRRTTRLRPKDGDWTLTLFTAQGCFRRPDQGMLLPMRPLPAVGIPSTFSLRRIPLGHQVLDGHSLEFHQRHTSTSLFCPAA